jgi:protein SCO1
MDFMQKQNSVILFSAVIAIMLSVGCQRTPDRRFDLKGKVIAVDKEQNQVTLAHEKIPGYMDAMTMPFHVGDDWAMSALAPGQTVEATLVVRGDRSWIEGLRISKTEAAANPGAAVPGPKVGDEVPDFPLMNQDSKRIHLHQYRGRPLLLTFIYTRCPLPDYCPRTSKNFSDVYRALQTGPDSDRKPHLLTVSFDTDHDTPSVLREYAGRYMRPERFQDWEFATGSPDEIKKITGYFGLKYWPESGQIMHSLVTALIGSDGRVMRIYNGNRWTPSEVLAEFREK